MLVLEEHVAVGALDRKGSPKYFFKAKRLRSVAFAHAGALEKTLIAGQLNVYEVRKLYSFLIVLADVCTGDLIFCVGHRYPLYWIRKRFYLLRARGLSRLPPFI
jgi:hypothetical protein